MSDARSAAQSEPALAYAVLPYLRSMFDRPGTDWTRHVDLMRAVNACQAIVKASSASQVTTARAKLEQVQRARWQLREMLIAVKEPDRRARTALLNAVDGDGRLVLFPDEPVEPVAEPRERDSTSLANLPPGHPFRRITRRKS